MPLIEAAKADRYGHRDATTIALPRCATCTLGGYLGLAMGRRDRLTTVTCAAFANVLDPDPRPLEHSIMAAIAPPETQEFGSQDFDPRAPRRVRHELRRRMMTVKDVAKVADHMIRVTLTGDLQGFVSLGFDDHIKLFLSDGLADAGNAQNIVRDFTPRRFDFAAGTLEIELRCS